MLKQSKLIKADRRTLNSYDMLYNQVKYKPTFNEEDWKVSANNGSLDAYINSLLKSDKIDFNEYREKYNLDYADSNTRLMALYNETSADRTNVDTKRKKTVEQPDGQLGETEYMASDYEYNLELIRKQNDYNQQVKQREIAQDIKDSMTVGDHIAGFFAGSATSLDTGVLTAFDNMSALLGAAGEAILAESDPTKKLDKLTEVLASDKYRVFSNHTESLVNFETNYTAIRDIDGNYTNYGKYIGGTLTSVGEMLPSMLIGQGVGAAAGALGASASFASTASTIASQGSFYAGMASANVQDMYQQFEASGADVSSAAILSNAAVKSALQWGVEKALGKILGGTSLDNMVFGVASKGATAKSLTKAGVKTLFKDAVQEGLEEVFQDTSDFLVDQAYGIYINEFKDVTQISFQSLFDAFVIGGLMSFAGSARNILSANNVYVGDKKLNKLASWQYGLNLDSFAQSLDAIQKAAYHIGPNGEYEMNRYLDKKDMDAVRAAVLESYAAYRMVTSVYESIGEERFKAANEILDKITDKINSGFFYIQTADEYLNTIKGQLKDITKASLEKVVEELKDSGVTTVDDRIKPDRDTKTSVGKKAKELIEETGVDEVIVTDGSITISIDNKIIIDKNKLNGKSIGELLKNIAVKDLVNDVVKFIADVSKTKLFKDAYAEYSGIRDADDATVATALLFDKSFFTTTLLEGNKDVYKLLSHFVDLAKTKKSNKAYDAVSKKTIEDAINLWCNSLTEYCILHHDAQPDMFLYAIGDSRKREAIRKRILRERLATVICQKVVSSNNKLNKLTNDEKRWLENKFYTFFTRADAERRWNLILNGNQAERISGMNALVDKLGSIYSKGYDGKTRMPDVTVANRVFNNYLDRIGSTVEYFCRTISLTESDKMLIKDEYKEINASTVLAFRQKQFKQFTNDTYDFTLNKSGVKITSNDVYKGGSELPNSVSMDLSEMTGIDTVSVRNIFGKDMFKEEYKHLYKYMTIDDLITNPDIYNDNFVKNVIVYGKKYYGINGDAITPNLLFYYFNHYLNSKDVAGAITMTNTGEYAVVNLKPMMDMVKNSFELTDKSKLEDIIDSKYIPSGTKLVFLSDEDYAKSANPTALGFFSAYKLSDDGKESVVDNTIYLPKSSVNKIGKTETLKVILHELQHAIQFANSLNAGASYWFDTLSDSSKKTLIKEVKKHLPHILEGVSSENATEYIRQLTYSGTGEILAYGLGGKTTISNFIPFLYHHDNNYDYAITPWGTKYKLYTNEQSKKSNQDNKIEYAPNGYIPHVVVNASSPTTDKFKPHKDEITEKEAEKRGFRLVTSKTNKVHFYKVNEDGSQRLTNNNLPVVRKVSKEDKSRYVSKRKYEGTNLEYFNKKYTPLQMSKEMQDFVLKAKGLDPILQHRIDGSKAGTLTEHDVMDYLRSAENIDDKTFKAINDAFFKNEHIKTFEQLQEGATALPIAWAYTRLIREHPAMRKYESLLHTQGFDLNMLIEAIENNKDQSIAKSFSNKQTRYDTFNDRLVISSDEYIRTSFMGMYDGTLQSLWEIAAKTRYPAIHNYQVTHKVELPKDFVEEAYADMIETTDITKPKVIEYLKKKLMTKLYQDAVANGTLDDAEVAHIFYLAEELQEKLSDMSMFDIKREYGSDEGVANIVAEGIIAETTGKAVDIDTASYVPTSREYVSRIRSLLVTIRKNLTGNELKEFVKKNSDIFDKDLKLKKEVYQDAIFNKTRDGKHYRNKPVDELIKLYEKIVELKDEVLDNKRTSREAAKVAEKYRREQNRKIRELERELESYKKDKVNHKIPSITEFIVENEVIKVKTDVPIPDSLKPLLQRQYEEKAPTTVKNLTDSTEVHVKLVTKDFYDANAASLNSLTQGDVDEIIDFYLNHSLQLSDVNAPFIATEVWMLTYLIKAGRSGAVNFVIDADTLGKLENTLKTMQSTFGTGQVVWREALHKLDPVKTIQQAMIRNIGIEIAESDLDKLLDAVKNKDIKQAEVEKNAIYTKYLKKYRSDRANRSKLDKALEKILQYERLAMLSGPGTWVRNWVSNQVIKGTNKLADGMNGRLDKMLSKLFPSSKKVESQYQIAKTVIDSEVSSYIDANLLNNGLLDMVMDALTKYDVRQEIKNSQSAEVLAGMIVRSIKSQFYGEHLTDQKHIRAVEDFIRKMISDNKHVKNAAVVYLGKMITEDLESGKIATKSEILSVNYITHGFMNYVAEAYKMASYDYMHKSNIFTKFESELARKSTGAYFMYKQLFPFAGASWNWFIEGLNYSPIGLAKSIVNFAKLEKTVERMEEARRTYKNNDIGVSADFAKYLTLRNVTKGVIGSVGYVIGALLVGFGVARIDEEDDKYKLVIADQVYIDISDLFGTQGIFLGIATVGAIKNKDSITDVFAATLDQLFIDSTFADVFNNFRYSKSFGEWLSYQPISMLNMMIPNFLKTLTSMSSPYSVNYSDGVLGKIEKLAVSAVPGLSYAFPHYYDPYTGEKQVSQKLWFLTKMVDRLTPFGLSIYNVSEMERIAIEYGINKSQLTGRYTINDKNIKLKSSEVEKLNQYYGQLNVTSFKEMQSNRTVYKIQQDNGKYKKVRWSQMTEKEKAAIISRTMTNNSGYAKIYVLTESGKYKYYATEAEYKELRSLGITKNVYKATGNKKGFIEN